MVEAFRLSGLTQKAWCELHGVGLSKLSYWIAKVKKSTSASGQDHDQAHTDAGFAPIQMDGFPVNPQGKVLTITFPNGVRLECPASMPISQIQVLIQTF